MIICKGPFGLNSEDLESVSDTDDLIGLCEECKVLALTLHSILVISTSERVSILSDVNYDD